MTTETPKTLSFREILSDALRYWEPRRLIYNGVLTLVVGACFAAGWPASKMALTMNTALTVFILAVLANIAYCAAYLPDLAIQHSFLRDRWLRLRWVLLTIGILFASALAYFFTSSMFGLDLNGPL